MLHCVQKEINKNRTNILRAYLGQGQPIQQSFQSGMGTAK